MINNVNEALELLKEDTQNKPITLEISLEKLDIVGSQFLINTLEYLHNNNQLDYFRYEDDEDADTYNRIVDIVNDLRDIDEDKGVEIIATAIDDTETACHMYRLVYQTEIEPCKIAKILIEDAKI